MAKTLIFLLLIVNIFWSVALHLQTVHTTDFNYLYNISYGLNFLVAGVVSFLLMKKCQVHHTIHIIMGTGSILFFFGQLTWVYYNLYLRLPVPYPGVADAFWLLFYFFTAFAGLLIMKEIKINFDLKKILEIVIVSGFIFYLIYSFLFVNDTPENLPLLTQMLNIGYPLFDALLLAMSISAIRSQIGNLQPLLLYFVFCFVAFTFGDTLFTYQTTLGTYWNGNITDAFYALAGYFFAMGVISLPSLLHPTDVQS